MIYQPRFWGHWIQSNMYEQFALERLICIFKAVCLAILLKPTEPETDCKQSIDELVSAHAALDGLGVSKYDKTGIELSVALRIASMKPYYRVGPARVAPVNA